MRGHLSLPLVLSGLHLANRVKLKPHRTQCASPIAGAPHPLSAHLTPHRDVAQEHTHDIAARLENPLPDPRTAAAAALRLGPTTPPRRRSRDFAAPSPRRHRTIAVA
jgi:hypothetical protein